MSTSLRDTLARESYLTRLSWALQDHPKDKQIVRELRTELTATATEVGMRRAVAGLGHPRALADAYLGELGRPVPRWATGAVWGGLAVAAVAYLAFAYGIGTLDTIGQMGGGTLERVFLGATTTFTNDADALSVSGAITWQTLVFFACVFTVPFLLGARVWRVWSSQPAAVPA